MCRKNFKTVFLNLRSDLSFKFFKVSSISTWFAESSTYFANFWPSPLRSSVLLVHLHPVDHLSEEFLDPKLFPITWSLI